MTLTIAGKWSAVTGAPKPNDPLRGRFHPTGFTRAALANPVVDATAGSASIQLPWPASLASFPGQLPWQRRRWQKALRSVDAPLTTLASATVFCWTANRRHAPRIAIHRQAARCQSKRVVTLPFRHAVLAVRTACRRLGERRGRSGPGQPFQKVLGAAWNNRERRQLAGPLHLVKPGVCTPGKFFFRRCPVCRSSAVVRASRRSVRPVRRRPNAPDSAPHRGTAHSPAA